MGDGAGRGGRGGGGGGGGAVQRVEGEMPFTGQTATGSMEERRALIRAGPIRQPLTNRNEESEAQRRAGIGFVRSRDNMYRTRDSLISDNETIRGLGPGTRQREVRQAITNRLSRMRVYQRMMGLNRIGEGR